jgi:tetratricopeptide (TPR) repeat protein
LQLQTEQEYSVPPLALPDLDALPDVSTLERFAAINLFVQRAQAVRPDFSVTPANAASLAEICTRLDGLPLAIELAAARIKFLSPQAMLPQLNNRLKLLTAGPRDLPARQQTLRGAIAWSYELLDDAEKTFFASLAVFVDGFTASAAREVGALPGADDLLASLTDKNLVRALPDGRYRLLETIREFARERLSVTEDLEATRERHAHYFFQTGLEASAHLNKAEQGVWLDIISTEHNNYRAALDWFYARQEGGAGIRLAVALWIFWSVRGFLSEGRDRLQKMLSLSENITDVEVVDARAEALSGLATLAWRQSDYAQAIVLSEKCLELSRAHGLTLRAAHALWVLGNIAWTQSDYDRAKVYLEESITLYRDGGDIEGLTFSLNSLGLIAQNRGEFSRARELYVETTTLCRAHGLTASLAFTLNVLGMVRQYQGAYPEAQELARESLEIFQRHADKGGIASALATLGLVAIRLEQYPAAEKYLQDALQLRRDLGHKWGVVLLLNNLALAARLQGEYRQVEQLCAESLAMARSINDRRGIATALLHLGYLALYRADLPSAESRLDESLRLYREIGDNPGVAEACEALARVRVGQSRPLEAAEFVRTAAATRVAMGAPLPPAEVPAYDSLILKIEALHEPEEATVYLNVQTDPNR